MIDALRDPIWQGISGIVALVTLALYIIVERGKFTFTIPVKFRKFLVTVLLILCGGAFSGLLGGFALATIDAFISRYDYFQGGILSYITMNIAIGFWFIVLCYIFIDRSLHYPKIVSIAILLILSALGLVYGLMNNTTNSEVLKKEIFQYGLGLWVGGSIFIGVIWMDNYIKTIIEK